MLRAQRRAAGVLGATRASASGIGRVRQSWHHPQGADHLRRHRHYQMVLSCVQSPVASRLTRGSFAGFRL